MVFLQYVLDDLATCEDPRRTMLISAHENSHLRLTAD